MKKWVLCQRQSGEGCDYTLACGMKWTMFEALDEEAAWDKVCGIEYLNELDGDRPCGAIGIIEGDRARESFILFEVLQVIDLLPRVQSIVGSWEEKQAETKARAEESHERAELERLKSKFGG